MPSTQTIELRPKGINYDIPPSEVSTEEYTYGENILFRNGFAEKARGWEQVFPDPTFEPQYLLNVTTSSANYWVVGADDGIYVTDSVAWFDITPASFVAPTELNQWTGGVLNGIPVLNNGQGAPWYWDLNTGNVMLDIPDWPANTTCGFIRPFKFHLIAGNITNVSGNFPNQIVWSSAAEPGGIPQEWTPTPSNDAGDVQLSSTPVPVIDGGPLRDAFMVYKQHSTFELKYVGGTFVYASRKVFASSGILARNCVVEFEGSQFVFTDGDIIKTDGQNFVSLISRRAKQSLFAVIDPDTFPYSYVALNRPDNEIMFCLPANPSPVPNLALVYNTRFDTLGLRVIGECAHINWGNVSVAGTDSSWSGLVGTWADQVGAWTQSRFNSADDGLVMANTEFQKIYELDSSIDQDGEPAPWILRRGYLDFGMPSTNKTLTRVWPRCQAQNEGVINLRVGGTETTEESVQWLPPIPFDPNTQRYVDVITVGKFLSFEFSGDTGQIVLTGFDVELMESGRY